ncbi:MAG: pyridoxamine 5'-phosphate oxidase family protein [Roseiarcus sp.]
MKLEEVFDIVRQKRFAVVSTVDNSVAPEAALVGFALTERNEIVFDTLGSSRKAVNIAHRPAAALVIGWDNDITVQIEGDARRPQGDDLAYAKGAYFREWPDGRARENWPDIAYIVVKPRWMRYANYAGAPVIEEFTL